MKLLLILFLFSHYLFGAGLLAAEPDWEHQLDGPITGAPLVTDQGVFVTAGHTLYQFSKSGTLRKRAAFTHRLYSAPVAYKGDLLIHAEDGLYRVNLEGEQLWHHFSRDAPLQVEGHSWGWGEGIFSDPWAFYRSSVTVDNDRAYYGSATGTYAVQLTDGTRIWHAKTGITHTTPIRIGERVVVGSWNNYLYGLDPVSGKQVWQFEGGIPEGAMADWNGWLGFNLDPVGDEKSVYAGNRGSYFYRIQAETGEQIWAVKQASSWIGSPAIIHNDRLYYGLSDGLGFMVQQKTNGNIKHFISMPHLIFAKPVSVDDMVYFATLSGEVFMLNTNTFAHQRVYQTKASANNYPSHVKATGGPLYQTPPARFSAHQGARWQVQQMLLGLDSILSLSVDKDNLYLGTASGKLICVSVAEAGRASDG